LENIKEQSNNSDRHEEKCKNCGVIFITSSHNQKCCCLKCYYDLKRTIVNCIFCKAKIKKYKIEEHLKECVYRDDLVENVDYVQCKVCNLKQKSITAHLKIVHKISKNEYIEKYNSAIICESSVKNYQDSAAKTGNSQWYVNQVAAGKDMTEYKKKMSISVSKAVLANPKEIQRRSDLMSDLNKNVLTDPKFRKIMSESAKKTSARPEIIEARQKSIVDHFNSAGEQFLRNHIQSKYDGFNKDFILSELFVDNATKRKSVDLINRERKIIIEYDGDHHFRVIRNDPDVFEKVKRLDAALSEYVKQNDYMLIRISCDCYDYRKKIIRPQHLETVDNFIDNFQVGTFYIGKRYAQNKID
jgi:hypothetical protein